MRFGINRLLPTRVHDYQRKAEAWLQTAEGILIFDLPDATGSKAHKFIYEKNKKNVFRVKSAVGTCSVLIKWNAHLFMGIHSNIAALACLPS